MATTNPITGDALISRNLTKEGEDNFERIFGKKKTNGGWIPPDAYEQEERLNRIAEGKEDAVK